MKPLENESFEMWQKRVGGGRGVGKDVIDKYFKKVPIVDENRPYENEDLTAWVKRVGGKSKANVLVKKYFDKNMVLLKQPQQSVKYTYKAF